MLKHGRDSLSKGDIVKKMQTYLKESELKIELSNEMIREVLDSFLEVYKQSLLESPRIEIRNFGVMTSELFKGRTITHPVTKERAIASPYYKLTFKPNASFKRRLREKAKQEVQKT